MARLEAVLFVADSAVSSRRLAQLATLADTTEVQDLIGKLNDNYDRVDCAFRIERVATGYQLLTRPAFVFWLDKLHQRQTRLKLSSPAMETLSIVAYRQPVTRADVEAIRGVQCTEMLKQLMERGLVRITGEDDSLGRPYLYGTTSKFLEMFGLRNLDDLPMSESLRYSNVTKTEPSDNTSESDDIQYDGVEVDETDDEAEDEDDLLSNDEDEEPEDNDFDEDEEADDDMESAA